MSRTEERTAKIYEGKRIDAATKVSKVMTLNKKDKVFNHMGRLQQCGRDENHEPVFYAQDDVSGVPLDAEEVKRARNMEIEIEHECRRFVQL